ncbi:DoxX family protein [Chitinophaga sp. S165]|uniref:DoxX family protein n=1 Tax=Chitinophaga sp. S165 TaxID=2135462 RepID=UPI000D7199B9|nr:DoxX family protein [Chitinophaga sp. S165]PWV56274.1 DoxX-like protein [Chitinophaga sp. S165]
MTKRNKIIYWIATLWLALGMVSTGIVQLMQRKDEVDMITKLGYPVYILTILAIWKFLGAVAVLIPRYPLLKEWAYAGFFFAMSGAAISHMIVGDPFNEIYPSLLLVVLTAASWYFRPAERKCILVNQ